MKKFLVVLLVLVVASAVFAGGKKESSGGSGLVTVGFAQCKADESDWRMHNTRSMMSAFNHPEYRLIIADSNNDAAKQVADVQGFIDQEVDYIVLAAVNETGWETVLRNAQAAGIPVILMDRTITAPENLWTCWFGGSFKEEGNTAVQWMEKRFGRGEANIVHLQGQLGASAQVGRTEALNEGVARNGWTLLGQQTGDWGTDPAKSVMTSWIRQHGNRINCVYAENDNMALGAIQALQEAGMKVGGADGVAIVTFDANRWSLEMTRDGIINANVECNPLLGQGVFDIIQNMRKGTMPTKRTLAFEEAFYWDTITQPMIDRRAY